MILPVTRHTDTRTIGRNAVREELARVAFDRFLAIGFDRVTFDDLATAAGVSRSTFLRYFGTKEAVVLFVFDPLGDAMARRLAEQAESASDWTALRHAVDPVVEFITRDPEWGLALLRLVIETPSLCSRLRERPAEWRSLLIDVLALRPKSRELASMVLHARVASALDCLMVSLEHWVAGEGRDDLEALVDQAFGSLALGAGDRTRHRST